MSYGLIDYNTLQDIGNAIRAKSNYNGTYYPRDMARAINAIKSGGGFEEPVMYTSRNYYNNYYDNSNIARSSLYEFSVVNKLPEANTEPANNIWDMDNRVQSVQIMFENCEWAGLSPGNLSFFIAVKTFVREVYNSSSGQMEPIVVGGPTYGLLTGEEWENGQASIIDMGEFFTQCSLLTEPYCGRFTTNMYNCYCYCYNLRNAVCGPRVIDLTNTYAQCSNIITPACGDSVVKMNNAYTACSNLRSVNIGPNVRYANGAYAYCNNVLGNVTFGENINAVSSIFYNCYQLSKINGCFHNIYYGNEAFYNLFDTVFENIYLNNLRYGYRMFQYCRNLTEINDLSNIIYGTDMFFGCYNLVYVNNFNAYNLTSASDMFFQCNNLDFENVLNRFLETFDPNKLQTAAQMFGYCGNVNRLHVNSKWVNANNIKEIKINTLFTGCYIDDENVTIDENVVTISNLFAQSNIVKYNIPNHILYTQTAFSYCRDLTDIYFGENVNECHQTCYGCYSLVNIGFHENFSAALSWTFASCNGLTDAVCPTKCTNMYQTYRDCLKLVNAACGDNVITMFDTYMNCPNLIRAACGDSVTNCYSAYENCVNLQFPVVGNNVEYMSFMYNNCRNATGDLELFSENIWGIAFAFSNCDNLSNFYFATKNLYANASRLNNAFRRTAAYLPRRNIVMANYNSWKNLTTVAYNAVYRPSERATYTNETYDPAIEVNVNNNMYNVVRCAYNTTHNVYIYCME